MTISWPDASSPFWAPSARPSNAAYVLDMALDATLQSYEQGRFVAPNFTELGPNGSGTVTKSIIAATSARGETGIQGNSAYTGSKQGQQRIGAIWPEDGDATLHIEIEPAQIALNANPANTHVFSINAFVDAAANCAYRLYVNLESSSRLVVAMVGCSTATGGNSGGGVAVGAYWTYGLVQVGTTQPSAPGVGTPKRLMCTWSQSTRKLDLYVEDASQPSGWFHCPQSSAVNTSALVDAKTMSESFLQTCVLCNYVGNGTGSSTVKIFNVILLPGVHPPGNSWTVPDAHSLTVDVASNAGTIDPRVFVDFQRGPYALSSPSSNPGRPVLGYGGQGTFALPSPADGSGRAQTVGKWNGVIARLASETATDLAVATKQGWSAGKTLTDVLGGTRTGTDLYFDTAPINLQLQQLKDSGVVYLNFNFNSTNRITDGGTSQYQTGTLDRNNDNPASCAHTDYHPHNGGTDAERRDADLCVSFLDYIREWGDANEWPFTIVQVKVGTEADTDGQWLTTPQTPTTRTKDGVDQAWRYRYVRRAVLDWMDQEGVEGINLVGIGFGQFKSVTSDAWYIWDAFVQQCVAWSLPIEYVDMHFLWGVGGYEWADRVGMNYLTTLRGLVGPSAVQLSRPKIVSNEQQGTGENSKPGSQTSQYLGYSSTTDAVGDKRRAFGPGIWSGNELSLLWRWIVRNQYTIANNITLVNMGRSATVFDDWDTGKWPHWERILNDGREMASYQPVRMIAECTGTLHSIPVSTDPTTKGIAGTRGDGRTWVQITKTAWAGLPTSSAIGGSGAQEAIEVRLGATKASKAFTLFRCDDEHANYMTLVQWPNQGSLSNQRIQPETVTADASGNVQITGLSHVGSYLLLEAGTLPSLSAGTIAGGSTTENAASVNSTAAASGGVDPISYSWYYRVSGVGSYALYAGATTESVTLAGLSPSTTYQVKRRATDGAGQTSETSAVTVTTGAAGSGGSVVTGVPVTPGAVQVVVGASQQFSAQVNGVGGPSQAVTWTINGTGGGSINSSGLYTAPATPQTVTIRATSQQDPTKYGEAVVTVISGSGIGGEVVIYVEGPFVLEPAVTGTNGRIKRFAGDPLNIGAELKARGRRINLTGKTPIGQMRDSSGALVNAVEVSVDYAAGGEVTLSGTTPSAPGLYRILVQPSAEDWTYGPLLLEVEA